MVRLFIACVSHSSYSLLLFRVPFQLLRRDSDVLYPVAQPHLVGLPADDEVTRSVHSKSQG